MKSYKDLLNEWSQKTPHLHEITDEERQKLLARILTSCARKMN